MRTGTRRASRRRVQTAALVLASLVALMPAKPTGQAADRAAWKTYSNAGLGFSLRYPASLHPELELSNELVFVDFETRDIDPERAYLGHVTALRIVVGEDKSRGYPISSYRRQKEYRDMKVGGRPAASYVSCGRGACSWYVVVPGPREFRLLSFDREEGEKAGPEDARYPLLSIINSIVFHSTFPK
jgi:hypothetical protein